MPLCDQVQADGGGQALGQQAVPGTSEEPSTRPTFHLHRAARLLSPGLVLRSCTPVCPDGFLLQSVLIWSVAGPVL